MCTEHEEHGINYIYIIVSAVMLVAGIVLENTGAGWFSHQWVKAVWYVLAFLPVGLPVLHEAVEGVSEGDFTSEFMLMGIATLGALAIGEFAEAVAVMLLYAIGEALQDRATDRARDNIKALLDVKPDRARLVEGDNTREVSPEELKAGDIIEVLPGEKVPADAILLGKDADGLSGEASFNTAALTGESMPRGIAVGCEVLSGMISQDQVVRLKVVRPSDQSAIARILDMVEKAASRKAPTETMIHRFAHIYTPVVMLLALLTVILPWCYSLMSSNFDYSFTQWFGRALIFLVISCPCALVISIPLSYFSGIGAASRKGILFKGGNYLDAISEVDTVVFDKTGTLTTGEFAVERVEGIDEESLLVVSAIEQSSTHPIAQAIVRYCPSEHKIDSANLPGYGLAAQYQGDQWYVGTLRLLQQQHIDYPKSLDSIPETIVTVAKNAHFIGYILLADQPKPDAKEAIAKLKTKSVILSGDKQALVEKLAQQLNVTAAYGDLLPEDKVSHLKSLMANNGKVAFVGDGINDAPVIAAANVGIAMGALGSDMAIETADVVIQDDQPSKVAKAISYGRFTKRIVKENITFAIGVKFFVMLLGIIGVANMWEAVFADTGVALLSVLNATRIFYKS